MLYYPQTEVLSLLPRLQYGEDSDRVVRLMSVVIKHVLLLAIIRSSSVTTTGVIRVGRSSLVGTA